MGYVFRDKELPNIELRKPNGQRDVHGHRIWTWYPSGTANNPQPKVVLFVWGFDPGGQKQIDNIQYFWNLIDRCDLLTAITDLRDRREVAVIMPFDTMASVETNGESLVKILDELYIPRPDVTNIDVIGLSMGGLIAKYALQTMKGRTEKIKSYFSYDTPHRGANVPLCVQYAVDYLRDHAAERLKEINSNAAREALFYHYTEDWKDQRFPVRDPMRTSLLSKYAAMADDKQLLRHIPAKYAIANGDAVNRFNKGTVLGYFVSAVANGGFEAIGDNQEFIHIFACGKTEWRARTEKAMAIDGMGGGTSDYMYTLLFELKKGLIGWSPTIQRPMEQPICFVPNQSALDVRFNPSVDETEDASRIAFNKTFVMAGSTEHVSVHFSIREFIMDNLSP